MRHEGYPGVRAALLKELGADGQFTADGQVAAGPGAEHGKDRHKLDSLFGQAIGRLLLVGRVIGLGDHAKIEQVL